MADAQPPHPMMQGGRPVAASPILPHHARRGEFMPEIGKPMNITLPGETVRGEVEDIFGDDIITVRLTGIVMGKGGHTHKTNDLIAVRRVDTPLGEKWEPISDREVREQEERDRAARAAHVAPRGPVVAPEAAAVAPPVDLAEAAAFPPRPQPVDPAPAAEPRRVLGPRRSKIARA
jgi:hypothetical protein